MINIISGIKFATDDLNIDYENISAAFSFRSNTNTNTNIVYPDPWATYSSTGTLNTVGGNGFFNYSGTGYFNGNTFFNITNNFSLDNSTIFVSYEKLRNGNEVLLSSFTGNAFDNFSGFYVGVNDANKIYLKYWNNIEGLFTFTYSKILSNKNLIVINKTDSIITIGNFNNNTFRFETEEFLVYQNNFINSSRLYVGGSPTTFQFENNLQNFSGYMDRFYIFNNIPFTYANILSQGFFSNPTGYKGILRESCYTTGFISGSGYNYEITGTYTSGFTSGVVEITGYQNTISGYSYSGVTGYQINIIGSYIDNCSNNINIIENIPLSGLISAEVPITVALTGIKYITGFTDVQIVEKFSGIKNIYITGNVCKNYFEVTGDIEYEYDNNYLSSLSYKEISLLSPMNISNMGDIDNDITEIFTEQYQNKTLEYNKNLIFDSLNENYFYFDKELESNEVLMFGNGQVLIDDGYELIQSGYTEIINPKFDYFISGLGVETNKFFAKQDDLFYDYLSGNYKYTSKLGIISGETLYQSNNSGANIFVFKNGQKLISGIDYDINRQNSIQLMYGTGTQARLGEYLNLNDDGNILMMTERTGGFFMSNIDIYRKTSNWTLHQKLTGLMKVIWIGPNTVVSSNFVPYLNRNGNTLVILNSSSIDIFTGSSGSNWNLCKTLNYNSIYGSATFGVFRTSYLAENQVVMNDNASTIFVNAPYLSGYTADSKILVLTGSANNGNWNLNGYINSALLHTDSSYRQFYLNTKGTIMGIAEREFISSKYVGHIRMLTGSGNNWGLCSIISGSGFGGKISFNEDASVICTSNPTSGNFNGATYIYTGSINNGWNLKQSITGNTNDYLGREITMSNNGNIILINAGGSTPGRVLKYVGNKNIGWSLDKTYSPLNFSTSPPGTYYDNYGSNIKINALGDILSINSYGTNTSQYLDAGVVYNYEQGMNAYSLKTESSSEEDYFLTKEFDNNFNYLSGQSGSLLLNKQFNHGCSQVYYNGIKQKINNNYIENSNFDLISGNFYEPGIQNNILIYNNTDDFFV